jgi:uncharacterized membrane protein YheB (UPF0754 family)
MLKIFLISIIAGFVIGFLTNWLAVVSLFHPRKKFLGFQGLIPRYKQDIAEKIGDNSHVIFPSYFKKVLDIPVIGSKLHGFFKKTVANEIAKMSDKELEKIIKNIANRELRFIEILGGVIGAVVGVIQAGLILWIL